MKMVEQRVFVDGNGYISEALEVNKLEEDEDDFRSCCEDEDELKEIEEENVKLDSDENLDEHVARMYFKGVSVVGPSDSPGSRISGVGVVIEKSGDDCVLRVQKRLDFYVDELVADYLALLDGFSVAIENDIRHVYAFTDSELLHNQIINDDVIIESPLLLALRERIKEQSTNIETFILKLVPTIDLQKASHLAQVAVGIIISSPHTEDDDSSTETCPICCDEKLSSMMLTIKCSHRFCSHCMKTYVEGKVESGHVPIKCPELNCKYRILASECDSFLPVSSYESLERVVDVLGSNNMIYCPYPGCSVLLDLLECSSDCMECRGCGGFVCVECEVPWHASMTCEEYRDLEAEEREDGSGLTLGRDKRWRRCRMCRRMIELARGSYHMSCLCGHEFCYSCGEEYIDGQKTCECAFWDEDYSEEIATNYPAQQLEQWAWDSFESLPTTMDSYSDQERSQLALIHRFLAGSFGFIDNNNNDNNNSNNNNRQQNYQSETRCTDSYAEVMKDLHQLPWLERFVSVISDDYYEDYVR
ncbi:hypothetical protein CASFOL_039139 [Castilleja foliolosa]|uniref:RBR-type E3 ubiquitin transferase n=1 Tax=Castilleja foliolosa TaxID=1961234 RepID=A0ABD3BH63_9LAMI